MLLFGYVILTIQLVPLYQDEELKAFYEKVPQDVLIVLDEAYIEYVTDAQNYKDTFHYYEEYPNVIIMRTFSKAYGLAVIPCWLCNCSRGYHC